MSRASRHGCALLLLALLPLLAYAPALVEGRLLGPGDGAALHYPLKFAVWQAWRGSQLPDWNPAIFGGVSLLAAYRPAAFYPPVALLSPLEPFVAFQILVLFSLAASGLLTCLYVRRLRADPIGAWVAGATFALGPYLVGHLDDTATVAAAPTLPLLLLAVEAHVQRPRVGRLFGLAAAVALNLLSGSPEAVRAGAALLFGRLLLAYFSPADRRSASWWLLAPALAIGVLLAAPQWLPTLFALGEAGRQAVGFANQGPSGPSGLAGLILRYVSHTPAAALALGSLPLALRFGPARVLIVALGLALALQWGRGPLSSAGPWALLFDFTLAVLGGLAVSEHWRKRAEPDGRRLRAHLLVASLASAVALSLAAATLGPLPEPLMGPVGVLAIAQILFFATINSRYPVVAGIWLLPLTASLLLQPQAREAWATAPTRQVLAEGTSTARAIDRARQGAREERGLTLTRSWPEAMADLDYANWAILRGRRSLNGYDPLAPLRNRAALDGMGPAGALPGAFFRSDASRLELLAVRWLETPSALLGVERDRNGLGETLDTPVLAGQPRTFPVPMTLASELCIASSLAEAVEVEDEAPIARLRVRLASGREVPLVLRAGRETAEWAHERPDVRASVRHRMAPVLESFRAEPGGFLGHRYLACLGLPGLFWIEGLTVERLPGAGRLTVSKLGFVHGNGGVGASVVSAFVSDSGRFREVAVTPGVRLYELPNARWSAEVLRPHWVARPSDVTRLMRGPAALGLDPRREAVLTEGGVPSPELAREGSSRQAESSTPSQPAREARHRPNAQVTERRPGAWDLYAEGPGLLVVADGWDRGWTARVDGRPVRVLRVEDVQLGVPLVAGRQRVELRHRTVGLRAGLGLFGLGLVLVAAAPWLVRRAVRRLGRDGHDHAV